MHQWRTQCFRTLLTCGKLVDLKMSTSYEAIDDPLRVGVTVKEEPEDDDCRQTGTLNRLAVQPGGTSGSVSIYKEEFLDNEIKTEITMEDVTHCSVDYPSSHTTIDNYTKTSEPPGKKEPAGPFENVWIEVENVAEDVQEKEEKRVDEKKKEYSCYECSYRTDNNQSMIVHVRIHTGEKPYVCDVCQCRFRTSSHLSRHNLRHTGEKPYACHMCSSRFRDITTLKNHVRTHTGERPYVCSVCEARFTQVGQLKYHQRTHAVVRERPYACDVCKSKYKYISDLKKHKLRHASEKKDLSGVRGSKFHHTGEKPFVSSVLGARYNRVSTLKTHERIHASLDDERISADDVTHGVVHDYHPHTIEEGLKTLISSQNVKSLKEEEPSVDPFGGPSEHVWIKMDETDETGVSIKVENSTEEVEKEEDICANSYNLKRSSTSDGEQEKSTSGSTTPRDGFTRCAVGDPHPHTTLKDGLENDPTQDGESLMTKELVVDELGDSSEHVRIEVGNYTEKVHTSKKEENQAVVVKNQHSCFACSYSTDCLKSLNVHIRVHTGEKPYDCVVCESKFRTSYQLRIHKLRHTAQKPCTCLVCASRFSDFTALKNHMRSHTAMKPYVCNVCDAGFFRVDHLKRHKETHIGEKQYASNVSGSSYRDASGLKAARKPPGLFDNVEILMDDVSGVNSPGSHTTVNDDLKTDKASQACKPLWMEEPILDKLVSPEHVLITSEKGAEVQKEGENQIVDRKKGYSCYACTYTCYEKQSLTTHVRTHTGERPYACGVCGDKFRASSHLARHKLRHTGEKPFECSVCSTSFRDVTTLKNHMRTHTGEKPYVCGVCEARFTQLSNLRCHEKKVHTREEWKVIAKDHADIFWRETFHM